MKIRNGFVSNSSSSSFVLDMNKITAAQLADLQNGEELAEQLGLLYPEYYWDIEVKKGKVYGDTFMDNFDMREFMEKIGINPELAEWEKEG